MITFSKRKKTVVRKYLQDQNDQITAQEVIKEYNLSGKMGPVNISSMSPKKQVAYVCNLANEINQSRNYWKQTSGYFDGEFWKDQESFWEHMIICRRKRKEPERLI